MTTLGHDDNQLWDIMTTAFLLAKGHDDTAFLDLVTTGHNDNFGT